MKSEATIRARITCFVLMIIDLDKHLHEDNLLIYVEEKHQQWDYMNEIKPLYWVLGDPIPLQLVKIAYRR